MENIKIVTTNRRASFEYFLYDRYEAGLVLQGTEIKSIRNHSTNISDAYITIQENEIYVLNMNIAPYAQGNIFNHEPLRTRKLLLHKKEIRKLKARIKEEGYTLIPTRLYLLRGRAKLEFAVAKGKKQYDKRQDAKVKSMDKTARKAKYKDYDE